MAKNVRRVSRTLSSGQKQEYDEIRRAAKEEFPPLDSPRGPSEKGQIALAIREARKAQGLTFEQLAEQAGMADAERMAKENPDQTLWDAGLPNVRFMHKRGGLQRLVGIFLRHSLRSQPPQFFVDQR